MWTFKRRRKRELFKYWDGSKTRYADPIKIDHGFLSHPTYRNDVHPQTIQAATLSPEDKEIQTLGVEAWGIMVNAILEVFDVKEWKENQPGLTQNECMELFNQYGEYVATLKKNIESTPTLQPSTVVTSPASSDEITNGSADSISTEAVPV